MLANEQKGKGWFCYKVKEPHLRGLGDLGLRSAGQGRNVKATTDLGKGICLSDDLRPTNCAGIVRRRQISLLLGEGGFLSSEQILFFYPLEEGP